MTLPFKPAFVKKYSHLTDFTTYQRAVETFSQKTIRVNTLVTTPDELQEKLESRGWHLTPHPWCNEGFYVEHHEQRRDIGTTEEHQHGLFFIQRSVSMLPALVLEPKAHDIVLDLCAAPGAKTTHLAALMNNTGIIIANESDSMRIKTLIFNLQRCNVMNAIVTQHSGDKIQPHFLFDKILLDAPCSGSGLIKGKNQRTITTLQQWNENTILRLAKLQKKLLLHAYTLLKERGTLVYSTCSLEPEEDENVVHFLLENTDAKLEKIQLKGISHPHDFIKIWPQDYNTEGFFITKIKKP